MSNPSNRSLSNTYSVTARSRRHDSFHQNVAVDHAGAAELAAFDIDLGAAGCGERAIYGGVAGGLRVIGARGEEARIGNCHGARVGKDSGVVERARVREMRARSIVKNTFVGQRAEIVDVPAGRVVDRAAVVERAGESIGNRPAAGIVDRAGIVELAISKNAYHLLDSIRQYTVLLLPSCE
jgi:hypothetical protein